MGEQPLAAVIRLVIAIVTAVGAGPAVAAALHGRVVHVIDGDGLILANANRRTTIRLAQIDAPEWDQPYGIASRQSLMAICGGELATAEVLARSRDGRSIATVICAGTNANAEQVRRGMAWVFDAYTDRNSPLHALEADARAARKGLWAQVRPVPPWEWRRRARSGG